MTEREQHSENRAKNAEHRLPCEQCGNNTRHVVKASIDVDDHDSYVETDRQQSFQIVECLGCRWLSFRHEWSSSDEVGIDEFTRDVGLVVHEALYPARLSGRKPLNDYALPSKVRAIYREAHFALRNDQRILAAVGIRALVEAVCAQKNATGRNLEKNIDHLVKIGVLTQDGANILHGTRLLGNKAAHEVLPPSQEALVTAIQVAENLLQNVFILPKVAARLPKRKVSGQVERTSDHSRGDES